MRIAFFGGTFDPPHRGHLAIAQAAAERLRLDRVDFAPVGAQPLKIKGPPPASFADRVEMVRLAIEGDVRLELSLIDAPREDGRPNYTLYTLARVQETLRPLDRLFCLLGADSFLTLPKWHRAAELLFACDFIVAGRPGFSLSQLALPAGVEITREPAQPVAAEYAVYTLSTLVRAAPGTGEVAETGEQTPPPRSKLYLLPDLQEDVSATEIRAAVAQGAGEETVLPAAVVAYIQAHSLYR